MAEDARFEDGDERPLRLIAQGSDDVEVLATLCQDAVAQTSEILYERRKRRFTMLLNRFRWEDRDNAHSGGRPFERVQSLLIVDDVLKVLTQDIDPNDPDLVLSLIGISFEPSDDPAGRIVLTFSGDGALALDVDCVEMQLKDVSRPYVARAKAAPRHPE
jgi:hypothetical protein